MNYKNDLEEVFIKAIEAANSELSVLGLEVSKLDMTGSGRSLTPPEEYKDLGGVCVCYKSVCGCVIW
ncbi:hypothetical protein MIB92_18910 [Aestuariirhabdus sp. Z084]|uniref:hypothetical protein n=1 Tax=Aestuariirhabdus haliotis TaxID=2918751 RepID=UPI00201B4431|nr:hypothetical protein [Aestuariirhabdus haliotis]MCL6417738.1 hypothetical protein [Aestuariirhabdus haliotis]MCL6421677.1 hypothetical protein [Aestuariirhabdus haliotis]